MTKNSSTLSIEALSLMPGCMMGRICEISPSASDDNTLSLASIHARFPRIVFISPLCAIIRNGCAKLHVGKVLVLKPQCTKARALVK